MNDATVQKRGLKSNFIYNFISQILTLIIPFISTPYLARVLREVGNGQLSYCMSIISYFVMFANLGFAIYGQREIAKYQDDKEKKSQVFWELIILKSFGTLFSVTVLFVLIFSVGFGENYNLLMLILSIQVFAVPLDIQFLYQGDEDFRSIALRTILLKIVGLICIFVFVKNEGDVWIYALSLSVSLILSNLIMWPVAFKRINFVKISSLHLKRHIAPTILIFLPTLVTSIFTTFDKTMIGLLSANPDYDNGCYEQAYKINSIAQIITTLCSSVMMSRNAFDYKNGRSEAMKEHIYTTCKYVWFTALPLVAGFLVLSNSFSSWFLGDGYIEVPLLLKIMSIRLLVSGFSVIFGDRFIVLGKEKLWSIAVAVGAAVNLIINFVLIPKYGAIGAAIATAITEVAILLAMGVLTFSNKGLSLKKIVFMAWKNIIAAIVMLFSIGTLQYFMDYSVLEFIIIGLLGFLTYFIVLLLLRDEFLLKIFSYLSHKFLKVGSVKMNQRLERLRQYKSGKVLFYALRLTLSRRLLYRKQPELLAKQSNMDTQLICNKVLNKLRKKYQKKVLQFKKEIDEGFDALPHEKSNKVWILWFQGMNEAPNIVKMCYQSILNNLGDKKEIILLNEDSFKDYIALPEHILTAYKKGYISKQTYADIIRLDLLTKYGGTWIDATLFCSGNNIPDFMIESDLFMFQTLWPATWGIATLMNSWFITSAQNDRLLLLTKKLMIDFFKNHKYTCDYWLLNDFFEIATEKYSEEWAKVIPVCHTTSHILQDRLIKPFNQSVFNETLNATCFHKLNWRYTDDDLKKENTFYQYLINNFPIYNETDTPKTGEDNV